MSRFGVLSVKLILLQPKYIWIISSSREICRYIHANQVNMSSILIVTGGFFSHFFSSLDVSRDGLVTKSNGSQSPLTTPCKPIPTSSFYLPFEYSPTTATQLNGFHLIYEKKWFVKKKIVFILALKRYNIPIINIGEKKREEKKYIQVIELSFLIYRSA